MSEKLNLGEFENIEYSEVKKLLKENNSVSGVKEFIRDYIKDTLSEGENFDKHNFHMMESYIESLDKYAEILKKYRGKFSLKTLGLLINGQSLEEFEKFCSKEYIKDILEFLKEKNLEYIVGLYNIQTPQDFEALFDKRNIELILSFAKEKNLEYIIGLYNIKTIQEFESLIEKENIRDILINVKKKNLEYILSLCNTIEEFERLREKEYIVDILINAEEKNLEYVFGLYNIKTTQEFESLIEKESIRDVLYYAKKKNLELIFGLCNNLEEFETLIENGYIIDILIFVKEKNLENILCFYNIQTIEEFEGLIEKKNIRNVLKYSKEKNLELILGLCSTSEEFERLIEKASIRDVLSIAKEKNLENILCFYNIQTIEEFEGLIEKKNIKFVLKHANEKNLELILGLCEAPEEFESLLEKENTFYVLKNMISQSVLNLNLDNINKKKFIEFLSKKVIDSKRNTRLFFQNYIPYSQNFEQLLNYYIENKQKSLFDMLQMLEHKDFFELNLDITNFKTLDDFKDENGDIMEEELKANFDKMLRLNGVNEKNIKKELKRFDNAIKTEDINGLEKMLMENLIKYFEKVYYKKLKIKIVSDIKNILGDLDIDFEQIDNKKLDREEFIEAYKMSVNPRYNKQQINRLLFDYLKGEFDSLEDGELNQYDTQKNKKWLKNHLSKRQQTIWLSKNTKEIDLSQETQDSGNENIENRINNHFEVAIGKINEINNLGFEFNTEFDSAGKLVNYFNSTINKQEKEIRQKDENLFEDLKLQIREIEELFKGIKSKKIDKIVIERELEPLNSLMMGNWVDGSCLSYYSDVGNYYSVISNTIDVNKAVFYIKDENGGILGRCLVTIGEDKKISRYKMYYNGNVEAPLDKYFDEYIKELAEKLGLKLDGNENKVKLIESDAWYKAWVKTVNKDINLNLEYFNNNICY